MPAKIHTFKNATNNPPFKKPKGKIVKLEFTDEQLNEIKAILEGHKRGDRRRDVFLSSREYKIQSIRKIAGGFCCHGGCTNYNTHLVKYKMDGITLVERYCQDHIPK